MFSSKAENSTALIPPTGTELRALIEANADRAVKERLGAPRGFHSKFIDDCERELERFDQTVQGVLERDTRKDLDTVLTTLRAVVRSCVTDLHDIDEELLLPLIIKRLSDATDDYAHAISLPTTRTRHHDALVTFQKELKETHLPWARRLLDRMALNDSLPAAERLSLTTAFFSSTKNNQS